MTAPVRALAVLLAAVVASGCVLDVDGAPTERPHRPVRAALAVEGGEGAPTPASGGLGTVASPRALGTEVKVGEWWLRVKEDGTERYGGDVFIQLEARFDPADPNELGALWGRVNFRAVAGGRSLDECDNRSGRRFDTKERVLSGSVVEGPLCFVLPLSLRREAVLFGAEDGSLFGREATEWFAALDAVPEPTTTTTTTRIPDPAATIIEGINLCSPSGPGKAKDLLRSAPKAAVRSVQAMVGTDDDGIWGENSNDALDDYVKQHCPGEGASEPPPLERS